MMKPAKNTSLRLNNRLPALLLRYVLVMVVSSLDYITGINP